MEVHLKRNKTIDSEIISSNENEKKYWRNILSRLLDITLFLTQQNLPFRGHQEDESSANKGNFLELVELLSKYDPILKEHLLKLKEGQSRISVSYLSPTTQNEFISSLANHVREKVISEIKDAKYFGIMFDSTPDISHTDQMSQVIRYVKIHNKKVEVKEVFIDFFPIKGKKAADISSDILKKLKSDGLDIMMCRSQGYDNAATMAGIHGGVQKILCDINKKAIFNGCIDHSLNLCGQHSFAENESCVTFFGTLDAMYSFFAASTHRWDILINHTQIAVKRLSATRWSAHYKAVKSVKENFEKFVEAIENLCNPNENLDTRGAAQSLLPAVCNFTFLCYLYFWQNILEEINHTQNYLQTKGLSLDRITVKIEALRIFLIENREKVVQKSINDALSVSERCKIPTARRIRFRKKMTGELASDSQLTLEEENRRSMFQCIDRLHSELEIRSNSFKKIANMFECIQTKLLLEESKGDDDLKLSINKLTSFYDEIFDSDLLSEISRLRMHLKAARINLELAKSWTTLDFLTFITEWDFVETLPMLSLSLRLFLTVCVSVASCERSFSKLKLIKTYLRSTMGQSRLSDLAILAIETELAKDINFDDVIDKFAALKVRKGKF